MDFEVTYTEEQQRFRREVRGWLAANVPPGVTRTPVDAKDSWERYQDLRAFGRKLGDRGWLYPRAPQPYGGGGGGVDPTNIPEEEGDPGGGSPPPHHDSGRRRRAAPAPGGGGRGGQDGQL